MLLMIVLASRLVPFISFDAVSYVAGLTALSAWRFVVATALGVVPLSFAFAAMGAGVTSGNVNWIIATLACVITVLLSLMLVLGRAVLSRMRQDRSVVPADFENC